MSAPVNESGVDWIITPADTHAAIVRAALDGASPFAEQDADSAWRLESATQRRSVFDARQDGRLFRLVGFSSQNVPTATVAVDAWTRRPLAPDEHQAIIAAGRWAQLGDKPGAASFLLWSLPLDASPLKRRNADPDIPPESREAAAASLIQIASDLRDAELCGLSEALKTALIDTSSGRVLLWETDLLHAEEDEKQRNKALARDQRAAARAASRLLAPIDRALEDLGILE